MKSKNQKNPLTEEPWLFWFIVGAIFVSLIMGFSGCSPTLSQMKQKQAEQVENKRQKYIANHPEWGENKVRLIREGRIDIGFTKDMVRAASGEPSEINTTVTVNGKKEQWIYSYHNDNILVYFEDNEVTALQK